jgi:hypothetical protein
MENQKIEKFAPKVLDDSRKIKQLRPEEFAAQKVKEMKAGKLTTKDSNKYSEDTICPIVCSYCKAMESNKHLVQDRTGRVVCKNCAKSTILCERCDSRQDPTEIVDLKIEGQITKVCKICKAKHDQLEKDLKEEKEALAAGKTFCEMHKVWYDDFCPSCD